MGLPSYAEYQLDSFSLAGHPAAVGIFLERLADSIAPKAAAEAQELGELKRRLLGGGGLQPWDKQYLVAAAEAGTGGSSGSSSGELGRHPAPQPTFQLEAVVEGLSELLRRSMGVSLQERPLGKGGWVGGVGWMGGRRVAAGGHAMCRQGQASQLATYPCSVQQLQARAGQVVCAKWRRCTKQVGLRTAPHVLARTLGSLLPPLWCH